MMQKITTQPETEQWTSDASESAKATFDSVSTAKPKISQWKQKLVSQKREPGRADFIALGLQFVFNILGMMWLIMNMSFRMDALYAEGILSWSGARVAVIMVIVQLMAMASGRTIAPIIDRWLTAREQRKKKN